MKKQQEKAERKEKSPAGDNQHQTTLKAGSHSLLYFPLVQPFINHPPPPYHRNHHRFIKFPLQFFSLSIFFFSCSILYKKKFCAGRLPFSPPFPFFSPTPCIFVSIWWWKKNIKNNTTKASRRGKKNYIHYNVIWICETSQQPTTITATATTNFSQRTNRIRCFAGAARFTSQWAYIKK